MSEAQAQPRQPKSILKRPADLLYASFFLLHLLASLTVDGQVVYPPKLVPAALKQILADYIRDSNDPLMGGAWDPRYRWFATNVALEMALQVPAFVVGLVGLVRNDPRVYPLLIAYGTLASSTTLQCIVTVLYGDERANLSDDNIKMLLSSYITFFLLPTLMLIDFTIRTTRLVSRTLVLQGSEAQRKKQ